MVIKEKLVRIYGYWIVAAIFYTFFMLEMFFSWKDEFMLFKTISITLLLTLLIWEPIRLVILRLRKKWPGIKSVRIRSRLLLLFTIPYTFLIGFLRIYIEDKSNLWGVPVGTITNYSFTVGVCLLFGLLQIAVYESIYFFEQWNETKTEAEELRRLNAQIQYDSLKVQIQPHFLFNTLNTLVGLIKINTTRAVDFTQELAYVYRYLLEANDCRLINLTEELKFTKAYFFLLKTRYPEGLHLDVFPDEREIACYFLPPLSLQIMLENAVKHNVITKEKPLHISIRFDPHLKQLTMSNNLQMKYSRFTTGIGLANLKKKFELLHLPGVQIYRDETIFSVSLPVTKTVQ